MTRSWLYLLVAEAVSVLGSQLTIVALPLTAILILGATPFEMGILQGCARIPPALFSALLGTLMDRYPQRRALVVANVLSGVALLTIPVLYYCGSLSIWIMSIVIFCSTLIAMAEQFSLFSIIPRIVDKPQLLAANSRFSAILSGAEIAGTALAASLIALVTAPGTIAIDAATFFIAGYLISLIRVNQPSGAREASEESYFSQLKNGLRYVLGASELRPVIMSGVFINFFCTGFNTLSALFIVREMAVPAPAFAMALTAGAAAGVFGGLASGRVAKLLDIRGLMAVGVGLVMTSQMVVAWLAGSPGLVAVIFGACYATMSFGVVLVGVGLRTLLHESAPPHMLGSIAGFLNSILLTSAPIAAFLAGSLADLLGVRMILLASATGLVGVLLYLVASYVAFSATAKKMEATRGTLPQ